MESRVDVVDERVTTIDDVSDGLPQARVLEPGLARVIRERCVDGLRMGPEERVPGADLVEHDEQVICRIAIEAGNISAAERVSSQTTLHDHGDGGGDRDGDNKGDGDDGDGDDNEAGH